jgi:hypothetical protein
MIKLLAAALVLSVCLPCRAAESCSPGWQWVSSASLSVPPARLAEHLGRPLRRAAPMLLTAHSINYWIGTVYRDASAEPACHATGSVAFYYVGLENEPELDFVKTVEAGGEAALKARLLELRWYDAADGLRHSWTGFDLADSIGWFTDERGERGGPWPISYNVPINALY